MDVLEFIKDGLGLRVTFCVLHFLILDPNPPMIKIKKRWNRHAHPNVIDNMIRVLYGLRPVDLCNIGLEYEWDGIVHW